jgi:hypothetical protein
MSWLGSRCRDCSRPVRRSRRARLRATGSPGLLPSGWCSRPGSGIYCRGAASARCWPGPGSGSCGSRPTSARPRHWPCSRSAWRSWAGAGEGPGGPDGLPEGRRGRKRRGAHGRARAVAGHYGFRTVCEAAGPGVERDRGEPGRLCQADLMVPQAPFRGLAPATAAAAAWCAEVNSVIHSEICARSWWAGRGGAARGGRRVLRAGRPAERGPADGPGGFRGDQRDRRGPAGHPPFHDHSRRCADHRRHRAWRASPSGISDPGGSSAAPGSGRVQRRRPVRHPDRSSRGPVPGGGHRGDRAGRGHWRRVGRRGAHPGVPGPLLAADTRRPAGLRAGHRAGLAAPQVPERGRQ